MRTTMLVALLFLASAAGSSSAGACDGRTDVEAAFLKQQKSPTGWRSVALSLGDYGKQEVTLEYLPPDRIYRKVHVLGQEPPIETIGIGQWAWSNSGAGWGELQPPMAKLIATNVQEALTKPPKTSVDFACLGTVAHAGKDYVAYQTAPEKAADGQELARTIYVDPSTGLPAFNVIAAKSAGAEPLLTETYTYPTDIVIEKP